MKALVVLIAACGLLFASQRPAQAQVTFSFGSGYYSPWYGGYYGDPGYGYYPSYYGYGGYYRPYWRHRFYGGY